ncbi:MAG: hypothetical protein GF346_05130 [Candidatus Eisenbacteria bacterium]|nr:hypothetical protein [Candidatus Latescibacterota bacterium]MBD3301809.1 hypothetical protein [Candidatus Eisenbacteria bacterium]
MNLRGGRGRAARLLVWIVVGLALRAVALDGNGLWMDEGYTAWTAHLPTEAHAVAVANDDAPPLYYAIQRILVPILPPNEASVRLLSAAAGVAGIVWLAAAPPVRLAVEAPVAFFSLGTYGVYYGRQARSYALLMLWALLLVTAVARVNEGRRRWILVGIAAEGAILWTHNVGIHLVVGANLAWLVGGRRFVRGWVTAQIAVLLLWLPQLLRLLGEQLSVHAELNAWIAEYWERIPIALGPLLSLGAFTSGARIPGPLYAYRWSWEGAGSWLLAILAFAAVGTLLVAAFREGSRREAGVAASFTLAPLVSLAAASVLFVPSYTLARTDAIAYAGFVVWCGLGFRRLPRPGKIAVATVLAATTILATAAHFPVAGQERENDRRLGLLLREEVRPGDWVVFVGASRPSIDYSLSRGRPGRPDSTIRRLFYPGIFAQNPASDFPIQGDSLRAWEREAYAIRERFEQAPGPPGRSIYWIGPVDFGEGRVDPTAADLHYPGSMLAYVLNGLRPLDPLARLRGDELSIDWLLFRVRRDGLVPLEDLQPVIDADKPYSSKLNVDSE